MKYCSHIVTCLFALVIVAGCASTKVTSQEKLVNEKLPRPGHIWVYDFVVTPADVPADSALAGEASKQATPQTPEEIEIGRQMGDEIATELVDQIRQMGMPAELASIRTKPQINDLVIRGYLLSIVEGSATKRVLIGFGSGASELRTAVEGYQMTAKGLRKLGAGTVDSSAGKTPGGALGVIGLIATANPAGLIIGGGMKVYGEKTGSSKIEGRAKATAKEIADQLKIRFQQQGWIK